MDTRILFSLPSKYWGLMEIIYNYLRYSNFLAISQKERLYLYQNGDCGIYIKYNSLKVFGHESVENEQLFSLIIGFCNGVYYASKREDGLNYS